MRFEYLLIAILAVSAGCGKRAMNAGLARDLIVKMPDQTFEKEDLEVENLTQVSGTEAIAETRLRAAFRLEKVRSQWVVREVRIGHGQWEKISNLAKTLETIKIEETRSMLDRIAEAIHRYRQAKGVMPAYRDYIALSDLLSPAYLSPLIRLDAWRRPLGVAQNDPGNHIIVSAGPDGAFGTDDDIRRSVPR
jgi:hypothetical protein